MKTLSLNYFQQLDSLVNAIQQQTPFLPISARDIAQRLLANVASAIETLQNNPAFANLPLLKFEGGRCVANATSEGQVATEQLFRTEMLSHLFAGLAPLTSLLTTAMQHTGLWDQTWLSAYQAASGRSIPPANQALEPNRAEQPQAQQTDQGLDL